MMIDRLRCALGVLSLVTLVPLCAAQTPTQSVTPQTTGNSTPNNAASNNPPIPTLQTVITVTGEPLAVSLAPASASIVDEEQIRSAHALTSADIMRAIP